MQQQKTIATELKTPPSAIGSKDSGNKVVNQPANQSAEEKKNDPEKLSKLWGEIMKHNSMTDKVMNFLFHPFVLLAGLLVGIYFLTKNKKDNALNGKQNVALLLEIKKLKKKNKNLQAQIDNLHAEGQGELNQLPSRKIRQELPPAKSKIRTFYLD